MTAMNSQTKTCHQEKEVHLVIDILPAPFLLLRDMCLKWTGLRQCFGLFFVTTSALSLRNRVYSLSLINHLPSFSFYVQKAVSPSSALCAILASLILVGWII